MKGEKCPSEERPLSTGQLCVEDLIGNFGRWQFTISMFYFLTYILTTINNLGITFHAAKTDYQCNDSKYQLTCGQEWLGSFSQSMYQIGYVVSGVVIGYLSDTRGRYISLWVSIVVEIVGGILLIFCNSIHWYIFARFLIGLGDSGRGMCLYMLIIETVGSKYRTDVILWTSFGWVLGYIFLPLIAYILANYRYLQLFSTLTMAILALVWLPYLPESPRWLIAKHRYSEAKTILEKAATVNGKSANFEKHFNQLKLNTEVETLANDPQMAKKGNTIWSLFRNRTFFFYTILLWLTFTTNGFIYHGFSLNVDMVGGDMFVNFAIAGIMEIPSTIINLVGMRLVGRKAFTIWTLLVVAASYLAMIFLRTVCHFPLDNVALIALSMIGKMFIYCTYNAIYIHAGEIFPTEFRHTGVSSCSIASRFGSTVAPFVKEITNAYGMVFTLTVFSIMAIITSVLTLFLPETKGKELVDRIV